jgi:pyruvate/2-oxoglutarate dehydrogenase complex dihydrolipoamide acyltransferase (E2) component
MTDLVIAEDLWDGDSTGFISAWLARDGEQVTAGAVVAEVMVEKVSYDLVAPIDGTLIVLMPEEEPFDKGATVGRIA